MKVFFEELASHDIIIYKGLPVKIKLSCEISAAADDSDDLVKLVDHDIITSLTCLLKVRAKELWD